MDDPLTPGGADAVPAAARLCRSSHRLRSHPRNFAPIRGSERGWYPPLGAKTARGSRVRALALLPRKPPMPVSSPRPLALALAVALAACGGEAMTLASTAATATAVRGDFRLDEEAGAPLARVPLGAALEVAAGSLADLVLDAGPRLLLDADAALVVAAPDEVSLSAGRIFCDVAAGDVLTVTVPGGALSLTDAAVSATLEGGALRAYVVRGEASYRAGERRGVVRAGEELTLGSEGAGVAPRTLWDDWTGGLVAAGPEGAAAPGMGSLEARVPDEVGLSRWPLVMRRLEVNVRVEGSLAITEVTQEFFNPASDTVEGLYRVRVPEGAVLQRFAVDRDGALVDGYVRELASARAAYEARVYRGSTEDPALLEWDAPGRYRARIYPIAPGESRRIAIRYAEWLAPAREGGPLLYRYPLGGAGGRAPLVGELAFTADVGGAGASRVRAGLDATVSGSRVELRRSDFRPRADLFLELFVEGAGQRAYRAAHSPPTRAPGSRVIVNEADERDYFYLPLRLPERLFGEESGLSAGVFRHGPLDVVVVADVSAGTDAGRLELGRAVVESIARRLGPDDRLSVVGADLTLRPLGGDPSADDAARMALAPAEPARIESALDALARIPVGGATDLGASLAEAAALLDPARDGVVVYVGDGAPTVGSLEAAGLREQLAALPHPLRLYAVAVGAEANLDLLAELARGGGLAMRVEEHRGAADASLRIFAHAGRPVLDGVTVELGSSVENVFPRTAVSVARGEALEIVGRVRDGAPSEVVVRGTLRGVPFTETLPIVTEQAEDAVDLRLRWAGERLRQQLREGASREEIAELGTRYGLITPYTSYYVPSHTELAALDRPTRRALRHEGVFAAARASDRAGAAAAAVLLGPLGIAGCTLAEEAAPTQGSAPLPEEPAAAAPALAEATEPEVAAAAEASSAAPSSTSASAPMMPAPPPSPSRARGAAAPSPSAPAGGEPMDERAAVLDGETRAALDALGYGGLMGAAGNIGSGAAPGAADDALARGPAAASAERERLLRRDRGDGGVVSDMLGGGGGDTDGSGEGHGAGAGRRGRERPETVVVTTTTIVTTTRPEDHVRSRCSDAARLPLDDRRALWRERLAQSGSVSSWVETYRQAIRDCEAAAPRERRALLGELTARAGSVGAMLDLYSYLSDASARAHVRSAVLRAVRTPEDLRLVRSRLGTSVAADWTLVEQVLARATTPAARLRALRELIAQQPGSFELRLRLLSELEAQGRVADAVRLADALRADPLADAGVRTAVGELLLRLGREDEARRAFSEIVEFAPLDELARRRLGDLYRAHGWFEDAYRQYQTLAEIRPDDPTVLLLLASAAAGAGRTDEALRLEQRLMETSAPSAGGALRGGLARVAQLWSSVRFALLRREAREAGDAERLAALLQRMRRSGVLAGSPALRASLTWTHPDARLSLWAAHPGGPVTRPEDLSPEFGLEAFEVAEQEAGTYRIEVRRGGEYRVGTVEGQLVVVWNEGRPEETVQVVPVRFAPGSPSTLAFTVTGTGLVEGGAR